MKRRLAEYAGPTKEWTQFPQSLSPQGVVDLANTTFVFGEWAIPGAALAKMLGLTDVDSPTNPKPDSPELLASGPSVAVSLQPN